MIAETPDLSIVLPSYREPDRVRRSVGALTGMLSRTAWSWEIVVVDDGGGDCGGILPEDDARMRLIAFPENRGKGAAVRAGMQAARGRARIFTDADLPFSLDLIPVIADYILRGGFHIVIGDRTLPDSNYRDALGWQRRWASRLFSVFVGKLVTGGFFDTQCGLKGFRGDVADALFARTSIDGFAFDVETIYLALKYRLDIKRIPVTLSSRAGSTLRLGRDSARMFFDVFRIKLHQMRGRYRSPDLENVLRRDFERASAAARGALREAAPGPPAGANVARAGERASSPDTAKP